MSSDNTIDIIGRTTQNKKMVPMQKIGMNTEKHSVLENNLSKDFKLFTTINKRVN